MWRRSNWTTFAPSIFRIFIAPLAVFPRPIHSNICSIRHTSIIQKRRALRPLRPPVRYFTKNMTAFFQTSSHAYAVSFPLINLSVMSRFWTAWIHPRQSDLTKCSNNHIPDLWSHIISFLRTSSHEVMLRLPLCNPHQIFQVRHHILFQEIIGCQFQEISCGTYCLALFIFFSAYRKSYCFILYLLPN